MFICHLCNFKFISKLSLDLHLNKKNKCNITTPYQCKDCNKYFKYIKNLREHSEKQKNSSRMGVNSENLNVRSQWFSNMIMISLP